MLPHWSEPPICRRQSARRGQLEKVVGLEDHVVELQEAQRLLAVEAEAHAVEGQHPVDREVRAHVAQQRDVAERVEPVGIVDQERAGAAVAEAEEAVERAPDARLVGGDGLLGEERTGFVAPAGVADLGRPPAEQHDRPVAGLLEPAQHHDLHEAADMQAVGRAVEADVGGDAPLRGERVEPACVGALVDVAALVEHAHEIGGEHRRSTRWLPLRPAARAGRLGARSCITGAAAGQRGARSPTWQS